MTKTNKHVKYHEVRVDQQRDNIDIIGINVHIHSKDFICFHLIWYKKGDTIKKKSKNKKQTNNNNKHKYSITRITWDVDAIKERVACDW